MIDLDAPVTALTIISSVGSGRYCGTGTLFTCSPVWALTRNPELAGNIGQRYMSDRAMSA